MIIKHKLEIDFVRPGVIPRQNVMQNDANSRVLEISLLEDGAPWEIPAGVTAALNYIKPDGTAGLYDTLPDGSVAYTISGSTITMTLAPQVLTVPGLIRASIILIQDSVQLNTFPLMILVEANPGAGAEKSENYYCYSTFDELNQAIGNLADLKTEDKSSLVAAVNEVVNEAGSGTVKSINGIEPDANGNVEIDAGEPGFSPIVMVNEITGGTYVHIRDQEGTKSAFIPNGKDGKSVSVATTIESTEDEGLNIVTFTDMKSIAIKNGSKGDPGYTPVKGEDYFTDADKEEFLQDMGIFEEVGRTSVSNNLCDGVYEWGTLESGGTEGTLSPENYGFRTANFLPVEGGRAVTWNADLTTTGNINQFYCICEYDADKTLVLRTKAISTSLHKWYTDSAITLQTSTKYVRFYIYNGANVVNLDNIKINLFYVENINEFWTGAGDAFLYVPHLIVESAGEFIPLSKIQSPLTGKKIVYDGDSICIGTYGGGGYAKIIADKVGGSFVNQAVGGARLVTKGSGSFHSIVDNLPNLPTDGDLYCFDGGVNDVWSSVSLGTYSMSDYKGSVDKTTICGALETIFRYCLDNFVGKPVCYIITHKVSSISFENYKNYHDSAVAICNKYSIPYYDAYNESGLNGWNTAQNNAYLTGNVDGTPDGCHPNEDGYKRYYVPQLIQLFERVMPIN